MNLPVPSGYAVDVSTWQSPSVLAALRGRVDLVMIRASHGATADTRFLAHVKAARDIGAKVGAYHFFELPIPINAQFECFASQLEAAGVGPGDICPAIDIERNGAAAQVGPSWSVPTGMLTDRLVAMYGECLVYVSPSIWALLGKPAWVLQRPLWLAQYTHAVSPDSPGGRVPVLWQHRVGAFEQNGSGGYFPNDRGALDQSRIYGTLPTIRGGITPADVAKVDGQVAASLEAQALNVIDQEEPTKLEPVKAV